MPRYSIQKSKTSIEGSQAYMAKKEGITLEETWLHVKRIALCDVSWSMDERDSRDHQMRYTVLKRELKNLQEKFPGQIAVYAFSDDIEWCPGGEPTFLKQSTDLTNALQYLLDFGINETGIPVDLISDGEPNVMDTALEVAGKYKVPINTIFVGNSKNKEAIDFMKRLSRLTGGSSEEDFKLAQKHLADTIGNKLLTAGN